MRHLTGIVFGAWTACLVHAADPAIMALRLDASTTGKAESFAQVLKALDRYPSCFDALQPAEALDSAQAEALKKYGIPVGAATPTPAGSVHAREDHAPRDLIESALLFASAPSQGRARINNGRNCASGKTAHGTCVEAMLCLAYGAKSLEFELLAFGHEPGAWYANTYLSELTLWRPFFRAYVSFNAETVPGGLLPYCGKSGQPTLEGTLRAAAALAPLGFPVCPGSPWPVCYILNAESVKSMSAPDIQRALSGGVLLDGGAVAKLQELGYGAAMQLSAAPCEPDRAELFTDDELNLSRVGYLWQPDAAKANTFALFPSNEATRVIGRYQKRDGSSAEAASVLFETAQGGRIAAFGFDGFNAEMSNARRRQLMLAADWVAQNRMPVMVETESQAVVIPRVTQAGDLKSVTLLNATIDAQPPVALRLRGCPEGLERMDWLTPKDKPVTVAVRWEGKDALVSLPALGAWQLGWLRAAE